MSAATNSLLHSVMQEATLETVTPSMAAEYLKQNRANRPLGRGAIADYVSAIKAGHWLVNGEAIKFDWNGALVDGQHRLEAIVKAGVSIKTFVVRGLDPEVFKTLDTGKKRSTGDVFAIRGIRYATSVGAAVRLLHKTVANRLALKARISHTVLDELLAAHPRFVDLALETQRVPFSTDLVLAAHAMFVFYMAVSVDEKRARAFFRRLAGHPEPGDRVEPNAVSLRERLTSTKDEIVPPAPKVRLAWMIEAWNQTLEGKKAARFSRIVTELPDWQPMPRFR